MNGSPFPIDAAARALHDLTAEPGDGYASRGVLLNRMLRREKRRKGYKLAGVLVSFALAIPAASAGILYWQRGQTNVAASPTLPSNPHTRSAGLSMAKAPPHSASQPIWNAYAVGGAPAPVLPSPSPTPLAKRRIALMAMPSSPDATPTELRRYEEAHHLHFHGNSSSAALQAWTTYLTSYPNGRFFPEACFNHAICLLRVGNTKQARKELKQIAEASELIHYRAQAARLLDQLNNRP